MNRTEVLERLHDFYRQYANEYGLKKMGLFGSVAREESTRQSDIDIVVEFERPNLLKQADLMLRLKSLFGRDVDVVALWKHMNPRLKHRIDNEAIYV
jgi:predicted nucleotidyltransferase